MASKNHVTLGISGGFMQVCHGKRAPQARVKAGDKVVYYSPKTSLKNGRACKEFTAIGEVISEDPYPFDMGGGFVPFHKDVRFYDAHAVSIYKIIDQLTLTQEKHWGYQLRFGLINISEQDFQLIQSAMCITH
ncbi:EVE domain-containing protein [Suttonella sp. R2A3]|uniref:EVE domain-containing protein n=1 Tax=Suttonella sp. R2A3 TaxID=2908648 RepID=UPI001F3FEA88|nr:EVE domain-containing protein [Suttonella sp. R2A3]